MKKLRFIFLLLFAIFGSFWWLFPQVFRCLVVELDGFQEIQPNVFVRPQTSKRQQDLLKTFVGIAQQRIKNFWVGQEGSAKIIFCDSPKLYEKYCLTSEGAGCSLGTPFGSWIILNSDGLNADVIAHEMCHDELQKRLGWWKTKRQIPTWFDEGLALQLDYRFVASQDSIQRYIDYRSELEIISPKPLPLAELQTSRDFFRKDVFFTKVAYFTAATEVAKKISLQGRKPFLTMIDKLKKGEDFEQIYFKK